jgi:hypothetical protein
MNQNPHIASILQQVKSNVGLTLSDLLNLLKRRVSLSTFQLAIIAGVDTAAFNKVMNAREGRLLHHDEIENLVLGLARDGLFELDLAQGLNEEASLWLMALQSAAGADGQIALIKRYNHAASEEHLRHGRCVLVEAMRQLWIDTNGSLPGIIPVGLGSISRLARQQFEQEAIYREDTYLKDAWRAFNRSDYLAALDFAERCIENSRKLADQEQERLSRYNEPLPPIGVVSNHQKNEIFKLDFLNNVATAYYIKGRSAEHLYQKGGPKAGTYKDMAEAAYEATCRYKHG